MAAATAIRTRRFDTMDPPRFGARVHKLATDGVRHRFSLGHGKTHCGSIYRKLDVGTRSEAVEAARRSGLLEAEGPADVV